MVSFGGNGILPLAAILEVLSSLGACIPHSILWPRLISWQNVVFWSQGSSNIETSTDFLCSLPTYIPAKETWEVNYNMSEKHCWGQQGQDGLNGSMPSLDSCQTHFIDSFVSDSVQTLGITFPHFTLEKQLCNDFYQICAWNDPLSKIKQPINNDNLLWGAEMEATGCYTVSKSTKWIDGSTKCLTLTRERCPLAVCQITQYKRPNLSNRGNKSGKNRTDVIRNDMFGHWRYNWEALPIVPLGHYADIPNMMPQGNDAGWWGWGEGRGEKDERFEKTQKGKEVGRLEKKDDREDRNEERWGIQKWRRA